MVVRALVCLEDIASARAVAARLTLDGVEGVVVDKPGAIADEARRGVAAVLVQHRFTSGEDASLLLRQVRLVRGDVVPAVVVVLGDLAADVRHALERQWRVREFLGADTPPTTMVEALLNVAGLSAVQRTGSVTVDLDPSVLTPSTAGAAVDEDDDDGEDDDRQGGGAPHVQATVTGEMPPTLLQQLRQQQRSSTHAGAEATGSLRTFGDGGDLSQLPPPGGDNDIALDDRAPQTPTPPVTSRPEHGTRESHIVASQFAAATSPGIVVPPGLFPPSPRGHDSPLPPRLPVKTASASAASPLRMAVAAAAASAPPSTLPQGARDGETSAPAQSALSSPSSPSSPSAEEDSMQIQELQRTQTELKKALLAERRTREATQKRVEELESRLAKLGEEPATATEGVPAEGVFEELRYPTLLARCRADGFTGSIVMQTGGAPRTVFVKDGLPVAFSSSEPGQRIGKMLVAQGRITDEQYMKAATLMVERSIKLTDALVELRLIDAETLAVEQRNTSRDQIIQGFEFVQGRFQTVAGALPDANTAVFDFGPGEIYVQGFRRYAPAHEMKATFETLRDRYFVTHARLANHRPKLGLNSDDERLLRLFGEAYTVEEACERAGVAPEAAARLLAALQALDLVEEWSPGVEQFRARLRAERQHHAEELSQTLKEANAREDRLVAAFQAALAGVGAPPLDVSSGRGGDARRSETAAPGLKSDPPRSERSSTSLPPLPAGRGAQGHAAAAGPVVSPNGSSSSSSSSVGGSSFGSWARGGSASGASSSGSPSSSIYSSGPFGSPTANVSSSSSASRSSSAGSDSSTPPSSSPTNSAGLSFAASVMTEGTTPSSSTDTSPATAGGATQTSPSPGSSPPSSATSLSVAPTSIRSTAATSTAPPSSASSTTMSFGASAGSAAASFAASADAVASTPPTRATGSTGSAAEPATTSTQGEPGSSATDVGGTGRSSTGPVAGADDATPAERKFREGLDHETFARLEDAENSLRDAVRLDPTRPEYLTTLARVLLANTRYERAGTLAVVRPMLDVALKLSPDHAEANELLRLVGAEMDG